MKLLALIIGLIVLIFVEILRVYFIMPFPGSQQSETIQLAYFLQEYIVYIRIIGLIVIAYPVWHYIRKGSKAFSITLVVVLGFYGVVFYMFNYRALADKMFLPLKIQQFSIATDNKSVKPEQLILGVTIGNSSRAYPVEIIGYHHQVRDTIDGELVMITYCTVCRTGRVFSPLVDGKPENFRLVGMDHFNAMFEDSMTKSWWRQVNGEAIAGPLKGKLLKEIPSEQMTLSSWIRKNPGTLILMPDSTFAQAYAAIENYDEGKQTGALTRRDSLSWNDKSWVVGIQIGMDAKAYDWIELQQAKVINDMIGETPVLIIADPDSSSFYSYDRNEWTFAFVADHLEDTKTHSSWDYLGRCYAGELSGKSLKTIQSYQEYWHSWRTFRPQTKRYQPGSI